MKRLLAAVALAIAPAALPAQEQAPDVETYGASAVDLPPRIADPEAAAAELEAAYPPELREAGVSGTVVLRFRLLPTGRVDAGSLSVARSSDPRFAGAAADVARRLRFVPALLHGRPVRVWVELPLQFESSPGPPYSES